MSGANVQRRGPGRFVTHLVRPHAAGGHLVATSRRHRKGLPPHYVREESDADRLPPTKPHAFLHLWAPRRLPWWIATLFAIGSSCFALASASIAWPELAPGWLDDDARLSLVFFVGSVFFTSAAWLQWLEALNGDVTAAFVPERSPWRWFGWLPRNLGYLASAVQLVGTIFFNFNTADAAIEGLTWQQEDLLVWTPNLLGCVCFLVASVLALIEVMQGLTGVAPRSVSWWIAMINLAGSVAFQIAAYYSVAGPTPSATHDAFWSNLYTFVGAVCFFVGAYLMIPEMFDQDDIAVPSTPRGSLGQEKVEGGGSPGFQSMGGRSDPS